VPNQLFYGDNLEILRDKLKDESVDLIYLDPPFNSNKSYNILFRTQSGDQAAAQIEAFDDTWNWSQQTEELFDEMVSGGAPANVADALLAMKKLLGENEVLAYLVMMTARLIELHRVLKPTGSIYLHCDPTASHYLKVMMDAIFGPTNFRNEVIWKRTGSHNSAKRWGPVHDVILFYSKSSTFVWNTIYQPYDEDYIEKFDKEDDRGKYQAISLTGPGVRQGDSGKPWRGVDPTKVGRHWQPSSTAYDVYEEITGETLADLPMQERLDKMEEAGLIWWPQKEDGTPRFKQYLDDMDGVPVQDIITDIGPISSRSAERLGYPTQKPLALLERIIEVSSNPEDIVLDPFCGCGTAVDAAQKLDRKWIGVDITYLAVDLIEKRLERTYGPEIKDTYVLSGVPKDIAGAQALFDKNAFDFERWAVTLVDGQPNQKQVGDKGRDGIVRFPIDKDEYGAAIVSVKGGKTVNPAMVRELDGTVKAEKAQMGILILLHKPTKGMIDAAKHTGSYVYKVSGHSYPKVQIITIEELFAGKRPDMPTPMLPYKLAKKRSGQTSMF
jgi:DNA modification methylase